MTSLSPSQETAPGSSGPAVAPGLSSFAQSGESAGPLSWLARVALDDGRALCLSLAAGRLELRVGPVALELPASKAYAEANWQASRRGGRP